MNTILPINCNDKKAYVDWLYYTVSKQWEGFKLSYMKLLESGEVKSSNWWSYLEWQASSWKIRMANNRTILPNEIVLDVDEKTIKESLAKTISITKDLNNKGINYIAYNTHSRGFHIHIFYERSNKIDKLKFIQQYGCEELKASEKCMIAIEGASHWKSGKVKTAVNL